ncbi:hypothetical protein BGZ61DRAFT_477089 [Ilyonectria robusta]|uniref:uncharacterized protein n=1 Tax=Ilyonectria robusta TaxID=1079257 RepID=UPI001E8E9815|nr:uncharacterized protein BGZ61DRAFT_477089 [Ilyonectria robusta]KAH8706443.1 hypothetical protein BGZ61DRAFT_477089 [Ilyonectria robusta]
MSFLTENIIRQATLIPRIIARQSPRAFSTSLVFNRTATEAIKDGAKSVDRAVSDKLVDGINATEAVGSKLKDGVQEVTQGKTSGKAAELRGEAKGKASELAGEAKGAAEQAKGKVKGAVDQAKSKM